jgi:hypothetical protein
VGVVGGVEPPPGGTQGAGAPLRQAHPHSPGAFQVGKIIAAFGSEGAFGAGVRRQRTHSRQVVGLVAQDPPEQHQVTVEVV